MEGLKVLELASVLAGPAVGTFLAELGATVVKVENPATGGDVTRSWKLASEGTDSETSAYFASVNGGKEHRFLNLKKENHLEEVLQMAEVSDVIIANFRKGQAEKFGLDEPSIRRLNPKVIYGNITGFGPEDGRPAYDVVLQAESGYMSMNGQPQSGPTKMPVALIDVLAAHQMKEAILLAVLQRLRTKKGAFLEVSLFDAAVSALTNQASNWLMNGHVAQRIGSLHPNIAPYGEILTTQDGTEIVLAIGSDQQFQALCEVLNLPETAVDERFQGNQQRVEHREILKDMLSGAAVQHHAEKLMTELLQRSVPAGRIRKLDEVFDTEAAQQMVRKDGAAERVAQVAFKMKER